MIKRIKKKKASGGLEKIKVNFSFKSNLLNSFFRITEPSKDETEDDNTRKCEI